MSAALDRLPARERALAAALEKFIDRQGWPNFPGREFTPYWSRTKRGVRNGVPPESVWLNLVPTGVIVQALRTELGVPIDLISTYRRPAYNNVLPGAAPDSYHMKFMAIDFSARGVSQERVRTILRRYRGRSFPMPGGQGAFVFRGGIGTYPTFTHVDTRGYDWDWDRR